MERHPATYFEEYGLGSILLDINTNRLDATFLRDTGEVGDTFTIVKAESQPLRMLPLLLQEGRTIVRWKSQRGESYVVEQTGNWLAGNWQQASEPIIATGATTSWTNTPGPAGSNFFFRVRQFVVKTNLLGAATMRPMKPLPFETDNSQRWIAVSASKPAGRIPGDDENRKSPNGGPAAILSGKEVLTKRSKLGGETQRLTVKLAQAGAANSSYRHMILHQARTAGHTRHA